MGGSYCDEGICNGRRYEGDYCPVCYPDDENGERTVELLGLVLEELRGLRADVASLRADPKTSFLNSLRPGALDGEDGAG